MKVNMFYPNMTEAAAEAAKRQLLSRWIGEGDVVAEFESALSEKFRWPYVATTNSGTMALYIALLMAGVEHGDEVITTPLTCTATNHPILQVGAKPVFADILPYSGNIDPSDVEKRITNRTKAVICVHWGGMPCDLQELVYIVEDNGLILIQDCAHALGSLYQGKDPALWGDFSMFSFQAIKTLTTVDGGALVMDNAKAHKEAVLRRWYGIDRVLRAPDESTGYYDWKVDLMGTKGHMNNVAAAIGLANMEHVDEWLARQRNIALVYDSVFGPMEGIAPFRRQPFKESSYWLYNANVYKRADFRRAMSSRGIETSIVHRRNDLDPVFGGRRNDLPMMDVLESTYISLPCRASMSMEDVESVIDAVRRGW